MVESIKKQLTPKSFKEVQLNKSKGILDDVPIRKSIVTRQGTITKVPTAGYDIVNKNYIDALNLDTTFLKLDCSNDPLTEALHLGTHTVTASANNTDVSGCNILFVNPATGNIVLGGLSGGTLGQVLHIVWHDPIGGINAIVFEHQAGTGDQDFWTSTRANETIRGGGHIYVCDGNIWWAVSPTF